MRNFASIIWVVSLLAGAGVASANVLLLSTSGSSSADTDIVSKIKADAPFLNVDIINGTTTTPSLTTLESYQSVMIFGNNSFQNGSTVGDELKQYIDDGHGLVITDATNQANTQGACSELCGNFNTSQYWALGTGPGKSGEATLGSISVPGSPVLAGVPAGAAGFDGGSGSYRVNGAVNGAATLVASWSDGTPFIVTRTFASGAIEVALNFDPRPGDLSPNYGFWLTSSDGGQIMANAITYAGNIEESAQAPEGASLLLAGAGLAGLALLSNRRRRCS
jgi:hypothetical protein